MEGVMALAAISLDADILAGIDAVAAQRSLTREEIVYEAIGNYLDEMRQIAAVEEGIKEADAGNFATEDEVRSAFTKWGVDVR